MSRKDRSKDQLRSVKITSEYTRYAEGSVLIEMGDTKVICTASLEEKVPPFLKNSGKGWVTAEYSMLPRSTHQRKIRDSSRGKVDGRTHEIQRLIGRALRSVVDMDKMGERTLWIDCDVIQADGGTRTASITGAFVAMAQAFHRLHLQGSLKEFPIKSFISAISVGIVNGEMMLDLCYEEDSQADVDMNIVMTNKGEFVELQGTAEKYTFNRKQLDSLLDLGEKGNSELEVIQRTALGQEICEMIDGKRETIVLATSNKHKADEISEMLKNFNVEIKTMKDVGLEGLEIEENGNTFEENALIKAREVMNRTGKIALADDSGLMVDVLGGRPGIYSARFAGEKATDEDNNKKLLSLLNGYEEGNRKAKFVSSIAVVFPDKREFTVKGICPGQIGFEKIGENGFGYDSLFFPDGEKRTFGQMSSDEKNAISHRSRALKKMKIEMEKYIR